MKRTCIDIQDVADFYNVVAATYVAAKGKRHRFCVAAFLADLEENVRRLCIDVLNLKAPYGLYESFVVRDPKRRVIHAACFEDRVVHHALMRHVGPVLDKALVPSTYACRQGKGNLAAVSRVRQGLQRFPWYVKLDVLRFFATIDHAVLLGMLARKVKGSCIYLLDNIVSSFSESPGKGLPIGTLTSQHFANFYLNPFDRFLTEDLKAACHVRYMDDVIWWCRSRAEARQTLRAAREFLRDRLALQCNERMVQINSSARGVAFCGFRILPGTLRLTRRKMHRYSELRRTNETAYLRGRINSLELQLAYAPLAATARQADGLGWRRLEHVRNGVVDA